MGEEEARKEAMAKSESGGKITYFVVASCVMAAMGGVIFGYDLGVSGGVMSMGPFLKKFFPKVYKLQEEDRTRRSNNHYCLFNSQLLTSFTSSLYVSGFVATLLASSVTRSWGRKPSIFLGGLAFLAGSALGGSAQNVAMLIIARLLLGVGVGFANQSVPLYLSEMAPAKYRGAISNGFQLCIGIGFLTANLINYETQKIKHGYGWRISLATAAIPASVLTLGSLFLPETPNSIIQTTGDVRKAELMLCRVRGTQNVQDELTDLIEASSDSVTDSNAFVILLQKKYRPELVMALAIPFFQQVTGINVVAFYAPVLFRTVGFGESGSLMSTLVTGIVGTASTFLSMLVVDRIGRKTLFLIGGLQMLVAQVTIGVIIMVAEGHNNGVIGEEYGYTVVVLVCVYVAGFGWSWGPLGWLVPSEIFPLEIRSQSVTVAVSFVFTFAVAQSVPPMLCKFRAGIFFFYGGWVVVMTVAVQLFLPETKNVPIEQVAGLWDKHWFWRRMTKKRDIQETTIL
ncbi:PREDICTED: sugar transport protein 3-like [Camelina sativa]|uniref:Sugar transport protein 3-like n=1 Tax=Camelina sativa TaxID=90675 RepID=A0ABM0UP17_CAMSA|nr:PREDICTED: sugar transport protein 3-like [Camelina sativa]